MKKLVLFLSFTLIISIHFIVLTFSYEKEEPIVIPKPKYSKVSVQITKAQKPAPKKVVKKVKPIKEPLPPKKEPVKKPVEKKKIVKKPLIKKTPPKKVIEKKPKSIIKKETKLEKPIVKKEPVKKVLKEIKEPKIKKTEVKKEVVEKIQKQNTPPKKAQKESKKQAAKSLEKFKKYKEDYKTKLRAAIDKNKKYPIAAKRLKQQGLVTISFLVLKDGEFTKIKILKSSGIKRLDKAALKAVQNTKRFKAFPKEINKESLDFDLPIQFVLHKR